MVDWKSIASKINKQGDKVLKNVGKSIKSVDLERKVKSKRILKGKRMSVRIKDYKAPSILKDKNRFFKEAMKEDSLFFDG
jgi:hypothetical protein